MKITDLNLLEIDLYEEKNLIYNGMCENVPDELKNKKIRIIGIDRKKLKLEIE